MITECRYKITTFNNTDRSVRPKCKRTKRFIIHCIGEKNCEYFIDQNRILQEQEGK